MSEPVLKWSEVQPVPAYPGLCAGFVGRVRVEEAAEGPLRFGNPFCWPFHGHCPSWPWWPHGEGLQNSCRCYPWSLESPRSCRAGDR